MRLSTTRMWVIVGLVLAIALGSCATAESSTPAGASAAPGFDTGPPAYHPPATAGVGGDVQSHAGSSGGSTEPSAQGGGGGLGAGGAVEDAASGGTAGNPPELKAGGAGAFAAGQGGSASPAGDRATSGAPGAGEVAGGSSSAGPCNDLCAAATRLTAPGTSGSLGTGPACFEITFDLKGGTCGNFLGTRSFALNSNAIACNGGNWPKLPAKIAGGYCVQVGAGEYADAYFQSW